MSKCKLTLFVIAVAAMLFLTVGTANAAEKAVPEATALQTPLTTWTCSSIPHPANYVCKGSRLCTGAVRTWSSCTMTCYYGDFAASVTCSKWHVALPYDDTKLSTK